MHWGYLETEEPQYAACECGTGLRIDRFDLLVEHAAICPLRPDPRIHGC